MTKVRTIAVMGATGKQGRGIINALQFCVGSPQYEYEVRPMTRSLTSKGAEAFTRDYPQLALVKYSEADTESLRQCFEDCYGAFINTSTPSPPDLSQQEGSRAEIELGKRIIHAARKAHLAHIIYATFPSIFNASYGAINIRHFETKHQVSLYIQSSPIPSTILCPGPFYTDFHHPAYAYWSVSDSKVIFSTPAAPGNRMGFADPGHDIGVFARAAFDAGPQFMRGQNVPVCGQLIAYEDLASRFTAVAGIKAEYRQCSIEEFRGRFDGQGIGEREKRDMAALARWLAVAPSEGACYGTIDLQRVIEAEEGLQVKALSWEMFLERTRWGGPPKA